MLNPFIASYWTNRPLLALEGGQTGNSVESSGPSYAFSIAVALETA